MYIILFQVFLLVYLRQVVAAELMVILTLPLLVV